MIASMVWLQLVEKRLVASDLPPVLPTPVELQVCSSDTINGKHSLEECKPLQEKDDSNCT
jgi:hypothetical protein